MRLREILILPLIAGSFIASGCDSPAPPASISTQPRQQQPPKPAELATNPGVPNFGGGRKAAASKPASLTPAAQTPTVAGGVPTLAPGPTLAPSPTLAAAPAPATVSALAPAEAPTPAPQTVVAATDAPAPAAITQAAVEAHGASVFDGSSSVIDTPVEPNGDTVLAKAPEAAPETASEATPEAGSVAEASDAGQSATDKLNNPSWPTFRGPHADGIAHESGWSADWPDSGLKQVWQAEVGTGFSSISIVKDRLYTMGYADGNDVVFCLNAATGKQIWSKKYPAPLVANLHEGGPGATPTVDGDYVYTFSRDGQLHCFKSADGELVWRRQAAKEAEVKQPEWGFTSSALIVDNLVIVDAGRVAAYNKKTGEPVWDSMKFRPGYGTPVVFTYKDRRYITVLNNDSLIVLNLEDGKKAATYPWKTRYATTSTTPVVSGDKIFISTGYRQGCALLQFNGEKLTEVYVNKSVSNHMANSILWKGYLYGIDGNSHSARTCKLVCVNLETGKQQWAHRDYGCGTVLISGGKVLVLSDKGLLATVEASPKGYKEISRSQILEGKCWTPPALLDGRVYARNAAGRLVCVQLPQK